MLTYLKRLSIPIKIALISVLIGVLPIISVLMAAGISSLFSCEATQGSCAILGMDLNPILNRLGMMGWFAYVSVPIAVTGLLISVVWFIVQRLVSAYKK